MGKIEYTIIGQNSEVPYDGGEFICGLGSDTKSYPKIWGVQIVKRVAHLRLVRGEYVLVIKFVNDCKEGQIVYWNALKLHSDNLDDIKAQYSLR